MFLSRKNLSSIKLEVSHSQARHENLIVADERKESANEHAKKETEMRRLKLMMASHNTYLFND